MKLSSLEEKAIDGCEGNIVLSCFLRARETPMLCYV